MSKNEESTSFNIEKINQIKLLNGDNIVAYITLIDTKSGFLVLENPYKITTFIQEDGRNMVALQQWFEFGDNEVVLVPLSSLLVKSEVIDPLSINRYLEACGINIEDKSIQEEYGPNVVKFDPNKIN